MADLSHDKSRPTHDEIVQATQLYRSEINKRMDIGHPSSSPSIESMTITLRDLFEKMAKRGAFTPSHVEQIRGECHDAAERGEGCFRAVKAERELAEAGREIVRLHEGWGQDLKNAASAPSTTPQKPVIDRMQRLAESLTIRGGMPIVGAAKASETPLTDEHFKDADIGPDGKRGYIPKGVEHIQFCKDLEIRGNLLAATVKVLNEEIAVLESAPSAIPRSADTERFDAMEGAVFSVMAYGNGWSYRIERGPMSQWRFKEGGMAGHCVPFGSAREAADAARAELRRTDGGKETNGKA